MANTTQKSLLERARSSSQSDAWRTLVEIYAPFIEAYLRCRGVSTSDIDDIKQEVMAIVARELPGFEHNGRKGAFRAWLRLVIANRLRSFWRTREHQHQLVSSNYGEIAEQLADDRSDLSRTWDREHNQFIIRSLLSLAGARFSTQTMEAFRRTFLREQSIEDVARLLGMSKHAVVQARARVLKSLRELGEGLID